MNQEYKALQLSNPWFDESYRIAQSRLFIMALRVRKQFLYENRKNIGAAIVIWGQQNKYWERKPVIEAAWNWINMTIPVISSTFASFSRMCRNLGAETLGHLFIDEAGQALPQAAVGAIFRSRHVMAVGDPLQIKPVLTLDSSTLAMLGGHFGVTENIYLPLPPYRLWWMRRVSTAFIESRISRRIHGLAFRYGYIEDVSIRCLRFQT